MPHRPSIDVDVAAAWTLVHGAEPAAGDWVRLWFAVIRLERAALVRSDPSLVVEVTGAGRDALRELG